MALVPRPTFPTAVRTGLLAIAGARIARGASRRPPITPIAGDVARDVTAVVPARDEADRIGPCLAALATEGVPVLVVDDGSTDTTREVARTAGATVVDAGPLPDGWVGKAHALHVGLEAATTGIVISVDADTRPAPGFVAAMVGALGDRAMVTAGARVVNADAGGRAMHASMLTTLLYRFGPPGTAPRRPARVVANGQCMVMDRRQVLDAGGFAPVADSLIEDVALARHLVSAGHEVAFDDATAVIDVAGYGSFDATLRGWGRSLGLGPVTAPAWLAADLAVLWSTMALPLPRLVTGRGDVVDLAAVALRAGVTLATADAFHPGGPALVAAPLLDPIAVLAVTASALRPSRAWKGRRYA
ncbi:MAG: glycosyltransferase [Acidimicrobiales bacterium]|nr:glycosyltransferase [Acidimicrobiales bacterium]